MAEIGTAHRQTDSEGDAWVARRNVNTNKIHWFYEPKESKFAASMDRCCCWHISDDQLTTELDGGEPCSTCTTYGWPLPTTTESGVLPS